MPGPSDGGRLRRTWPQRLLIGFNACVIVVALLMAGSLAYAKRTVSHIRRTATAPGLLVSPEDLKPGEPENYLVVGVDSDSGLPANDPVRNGRDTGPEATAGLRSDTIMVVRVDPGATTAKILSPSLETSGSTSRATAATASTPPSRSATASPICSSRRSKRTSTSTSVTTSRSTSPASRAW